MALDADRNATDPVGVTHPEAPLGFWRSYRTARRNVLELIPRQAFEQPVLTGGKGRGWIMLMEPAALERVLKTNEPNYPKSRVVQRLLSPRRGSNLVIAEGAEWRWQRRAMSPMFRANAILENAQIFSDAAEAAARRLEGAGEAPFDVYPLMTGATCDVICDLALSGRDAIDREGLADSVETFVANIARLSLFDLIGVPNWVPRPGMLLARTKVDMDQVTDAMIARRVSEGPRTPPDFVDMLIAAEDPETGQRLSAVDQRNNLLGFLFAGHETTALALTWALYLLALDRAAQEKAAAEARAVLGGRAAEGRDCASLPYARQVIEETLRLYPPAGFLTRAAREADELAGHEVRAGMTVILPIYALHRHRLLWEAPERFDPGRFAPEEVKARPRYAYLPFGGGPRICIGLAMAVMEAQIILATLLDRFEFTLPEGFEPVPRMWFTLRPGTGMPLIVRPRR
ncbi:MAG: cytochrome P450 [Pseudomonadota bacterium]